MKFEQQFDAFHEQAMKATGLDDFGGNEYHEGMRVLLKSFDTTAKFNPFGVGMISESIVGMLAGRLIEEQGLKAFPDFASAPVTKPLIIVGMGRTGTTVTHRLISHDPGLQSLPLWLALTPMPRPPRDTWESNPLYQQAVESFDKLNEMNPTIKDFHPMIPSEPDECRFALDHSFWSPGIATQYTVPDYAAWCLQTDASYAERRYKRVLGLIAGGSSKRWFLKDPCHTWCMPALMETFPDACIVSTYRDPAESLTSIANVIYQIRPFVEDDVDPKAMGREILKHWAMGLEKFEDEREKRPSQFFDIHMHEIRRDPIAAVERIYRYFDIPITDEARVAWSTLGLNDPAARHVSRKVTPEEYGMTKEMIYKQVGRYYDHYRQVEASVKAKA